MNKEIQAKWTTALRSGKYLQGTGNLAVESYKGGPFYYCCLGVLCEVIDEPVKQTEGLFAFPREEILSLAGINWEQAKELACMNDSGRYTFNQIADHIDKM